MVAVGAEPCRIAEKGKPIPTHDIWIAARARQSGGELAARDGHFAELPMLTMAVEIPLAG